MRNVAAYSGGTVWESHPLRVAAGVSVSLSRRTCDPPQADRQGPEYSRVATQRCFFVTLSDRVRSWDATIPSQLKGNA